MDEPLINPNDTQLEITTLSNPSKVLQILDELMYATHIEKLLVFYYVDDFHSKMLKVLRETKTLKVVWFISVRFLSHLTYISDIITAVTVNESILELDLSGNAFMDGLASSAVENLLINNNTLTSLGLRNCKLSTCDMIKIASGLSKNNSLQILDLGQNPGRGYGVCPGISQLLGVLHTNKSLLKISLDFGSVSSKKLLRMLSSNNTLQVIKFVRLYRSKFSKEFLKELYHILSQNQNTSLYGVTFSHKDPDEYVEPIIPYLERNRIRNVSLANMCSKLITTRIRNIPSHYPRIIILHNKHL